MRFSSTVCFHELGEPPGAGRLLRAGLAQLVERNLCKIEVTVSNTASRSNSPAECHSDTRNRLLRNQAGYEYARVPP